MDTISLSTNNINKLIHAGFIPNDITYHSLKTNLQLFDAQLKNRKIQSKKSNNKTEVIWVYDINKLRKGIIPVPLQYQLGLALKRIWLRNGRQYATFPNIVDYITNRVLNIHVSKEYIPILLRKLKDAAALLTKDHPNQWLLSEVPKRKSKWIRGSSKILTKNGEPVTTDLPTSYATRLAKDKATFTISDTDLASMETLVNANLRALNVIGLTVKVINAWDTSTDGIKKLTSKLEHSAPVVGIADDVPRELQSHILLLTEDDIQIRYTAFGTPSNTAIKITHYDTYLTSQLLEPHITALLSIIPNGMIVRKCGNVPDCTDDYDTTQFRRRLDYQYAITSTKEQYPEWCLTQRGEVVAYSIPSKYEPKFIKMDIPYVLSNQSCVKITLKTTGIVKHVDFYLPHAYYDVAHNFEKEGGSLAFVLQKGITEGFSGTNHFNLRPEKMSDVVVRVSGATLPLNYHNHFSAIVRKWMLEIVGITNPMEMVTTNKQLIDRQHPLIVIGNKGSMKSGALKQFVKTMNMPFISNWKQPMFYFLDSDHYGRAITAVKAILDENPEMPTVEAWDRAIIALVSVPDSFSDEGITSYFEILMQNWLKTKFDTSRLESYSNYSLLRCAGIGLQNKCWKTFAPIFNSTYTDPVLGFKNFWQAIQRICANKCIILALHTTLEVGYLGVNAPSDTIIQLETTYDPTDAIMNRNRDKGGRLGVLSEIMLYYMYKRMTGICAYGVASAGDISWTTESYLGYWEGLNMES